MATFIFHTVASHDSRPDIQFTAKVTRTGTTLETAQTDAQAYVNGLIDGYTVTTIREFDADGDKNVDYSCQPNLDRIDPDTGEE